MVQAPILLFAALLLAPAMQFRRQIFYFISLSALIAFLARYPWRGSAPLWIAILLVAIWSNLHGGFFIGTVVLGCYGASMLLADVLARRSPPRSLNIIAITAAAAASTLCTFLIPPAHDTWYTLVRSLLNPTTPSNILDWKPLLASLTPAPAGSIDQKYFAVALFFFAAAVISVILTPKADDAPMLAVAAVMLTAAFAAQRNIPIATIAIAPSFANHLGLLLRPRAVTTPASTRSIPRAGRLITEILIAIVAIAFTRFNGIVTPGIDASGVPADSVNFIQH